MVEYTMLKSTDDENDKPVSKTKKKIFTYKQFFAAFFGSIVSTIIIEMIYAWINGIPQIQFWLSMAPHVFYIVSAFWFLMIGFALGKGDFLHSLLAAILLFVLTMCGYLFYVINGGSMLLPCVSRF